MNLPQRRQQVQVLVEVCALTHSHTFIQVLLRINTQ